MKKIFNVNLAILALFIAAGFAMTSCVMEPDGKNSGIFTSHNPFSIRITNHSSHNLVAFAGDVSNENLIGGVYKNTSNHGLPMNTKFFTPNPNYFRMVFITEDDYNAYKNNLGQVPGNRVITSMFVFWNGNAGENTKVYEIAATMGGDNKFTVYNPTNFNVEIRVNGPSGPTLGYVPKGMATTTLSCTDLELIAFPVFLYENTTREVVETIFPMVDGPVPPGGKIPARQSMNFENKSGVQSMNLSSLVTSLTERKAGASYLNVVNSTGVGDIAFIRNNVIQTTATGTRYFSDNREFRIDMLRSGDTYQESRSISGLSIETGGLVYPVKAVQDPNMVNFPIRSDMIYSIMVTGTSFADFKATIELRVENDPETEQPYLDAPIPMNFSVTGWGD